MTKRPKKTFRGNKGYLVVTANKHDAVPLVSTAEIDRRPSSCTTKLKCPNHGSGLCSKPGLPGLVRTKTVSRWTCRVFIRPVCQREAFNLGL